MELNTYRINYDQIILDLRLPVAIRLLAAKLKSNPMMTLEKFFTSLSDHELEELRELTYDVDEAGAELLLLTMMLSAAEGTSALTEDELNSHIRATIIFISTTILHRQGLVTAHFKNFSYGAEMADLEMATPTELGLEYVKRLKDDTDGC